jgi:hypothetical protein
MKLLICFLLLLTAAGAAEKRAKPPARPVPPPLVVPADAKPTEPFTWQYTDPQGKKWIYRKTPWGVVRYEDKPDPERDAARKAEADWITAVEDGDYVRFERPGPFGTWKWRKKKSELDDVEKQAWDRVQAKKQATHEKAAQE